MTPTPEQQQAYKREIMEMCRRQWAFEKAEQDRENRKMVRWGIAIGIATMVYMAVVLWYAAGAVRVSLWEHPKREGGQWPTWMRG